MSRGNRDSAVRGNRNAHDVWARRRIEREVNSTIRDGLKVLRLVFRGVSLVVRYHEAGETPEAFEVLKSGGRFLTHAADHLGLSSQATGELVIKPIEDELELMYDSATADRLAQTLRQCLNRPVMERVS